VVIVCIVRLAAHALSVPRPRLVAALAAWRSLVGAELIVSTFPMAASWVDPMLRIEGSRCCLLNHVGCFTQ